MDKYTKFILTIIGTSILFVTSIIAALSKERYPKLYRFLTDVLSVFRRSESSPKKTEKKQRENEQEKYPFIKKSTKNNK